MSPNFTYDFESVTHIVADALGQPGRRTFFLQARQGRRTASLIMEKQQVAALAASVLQLLDELQSQHPELEPADSPSQLPRLVEPIDPAFRVGQLGLGYDEDRDLIVVVAQALPTEEPDEDDEEGGVLTKDDLPRARFFATRSQMRALSEKALRAVGSGRPDCPLCGRPIDAAGHFCPRTNGHAFPLAF
ncbi:MAG: DUF3090 family protein [Caldilineaceae bacterium]|nr:DUF3090 family protein [Caldilineaceae bacterium]HRJ44304.1 DUF3090 domain-containing protein [Caldilineaceae bacterium]